ncbi:MAG: transposase [Verrucomicrobiales bacterium]
MRRNRHSLLGSTGHANCYHVVSRFAGQALVFGDAEKEFFRSTLAKQLEFSGLRCLAWCFMGNHFHLLLEVPDKEKALAGWAEDDFIERLQLLSSEIHTRRVLSDVKMWRENGNAKGVADALEAVRARLFDLSAFMKEFKHRFSIWFNRRHGRRGILWEERFKSVLVEGKGGSSAAGIGGLLAVAAYIDLNPVRAGLVEDPKDYRWCSYAAAVAGDKTARAGVARCAGEGKSAGWRKIGRSYRMTLFGVGEERIGGATVDGASKRRRGFTQVQIERVIKEGGSLPLAVLLRCRMRDFTEGAALGGRHFLEEFLKDKNRGKNRGKDRGRVSNRTVKPVAAPGASALGLVSADRRRRGAITASG